MHHGYVAATCSIATSPACLDRARPGIPDHLLGYQLCAAKYTAGGRGQARGSPDGDSRGPVHTVSLDPALFIGEVDQHYRWVTQHFKPLTEPLGSVAQVPSCTGLEPRG